jgi:hypothetical protein
VTYAGIAEIAFAGPAIVWVQATSLDLTRRQLDTVGTKEAT